jgi:hypothetical protein
MHEPLCSSTSPNRDVAMSPINPARWVPHRFLRLASAALAGALAAACAADAVTESPIGGAARIVGAATSAPEPAGFVREARPAGQPDFIPVGVTPPGRAAPGRSPEELKQLESELDAQRDRSKTFARRPAPASTYDGSIPPRPKPVPPELRLD